MKTKVHPAFKLNGISFVKKDLKEVGYSLIKEGEPFENEIGDFLLDWMNNKPTISVTTSGSTGRPKSIELKKENMVNSALATAYFFKLKAGYSTLLCLPSKYIAGKMMLVRAMVLGLELDYVEPSSHPLRHISKTYDFSAMVPLQLENSLEAIDGVKTLIVGGATLSSVLKEKVQNKKTEVFETYGMTETITHIAASKISPIRLTAVEALENPFKTLPNITISKDKRDCLVINAPSIADETIFTNDLVELVSETEFIWLGRYDNVINSGGVKLIPEQIEVKLSRIITNRFFVSGLPDDQLGQKLVLIVEGEIDKSDMLQKIKSLKTLNKFEVPKEVFAINKFMETANGKIQRIEVLDKILHSIR